MARLIGIIFLILVAAAGWFATTFWLALPQNISAVQPVRGTAVQAVYATGTVEAAVMLPVAPRVTARLAELHADEAMQVQQGQLLARFEDEDIRRQLDEALVRVDLAEKQDARRATLKKIGGISREEAERATAELETAQAEVARLRAELDYLHLSAPENGRIIRRDGEPGELVTSGQPVFWLAAGGLRITAEVDEEDISLVQPGQQVILRADAFPNRIFEGTVDSITPKGDPVARSYRVRIQLKDSNTPLMIGMTTETNIVVQKKENAVLLPAATLRGDSVFVARNGRAVQVPVTIGIRSTQSVEISQGLETKDQVLEPGENTVHEGDKVNPVLRDWRP